MSNRARVFKPQWIVSGSLATDYRSDWLNIEGLDNLSLHLSWVGTPTSVLIVEGTNDGPALNASTRKDAPSGRVGLVTPILTVASGNPAGADGSLIIPLTDRAERWIRLFVDRTSGDGTLQGAFAGKGI